MSRAYECYLVGEPTSQHGAGSYCEGFSAILRLVRQTLPGGAKNNGATVVGRAATVRATSFQRAVENVTVTRQESLSALFSQISQLGEPWHFIAPNIQQKEHFVPKPTMRRLLEQLELVRGASVEAIEAAYLRFCRANSQCGGHVHGRELAPVLGCVKEREVFCHYLFRTHPLFRSLDHAREFVRRLVEGARLSVNEQAVLLGQFVIWCTWASRGGEPFAFATTSHPDELRANLGLPPSEYDRLLVFRYNRSDVGNLLRPTVLDAELHSFFAPPPLDEIRFGLTLPWKEAHLPELLKLLGTRLKRRPEALHGPIAAGVAGRPELR